jgi:tetratricopeptide (TPR) repeat protein
MGGCAVRERGVQVTPYDHQSRLPAYDHDLNELIRTTRQKNLESYCLFWLDDAVRSPELIETPGTLRSIIDRVNLFETSNECEQEFERIENEKIFLIANHIQGRLLIPKVHDHKQLVSIYLYQNYGSIDKDSMGNNYTKIKGVFDSFSEAKRYLEDDVRLYANLDDAIVLDLPDDGDELYRERFSLFLATINSGTENVHGGEARKRLIEMCSEYYDGNIEETNFIDEFSRLYKSDNAISWYMRESCFHRLLSRAFTVRDMNLLVDMYPFIVDLNRNLQQEHSKQSPSKVFRGQFLSTERIALLKKNIGQIITMQCFFCAQSSRDQALELLQNVKTSDPTLKPILFEINVSGMQSNTLPSVLFILGSKFKIDDVTGSSILLSQCCVDSNDDFDLSNEPPSIIEGILVYLKEGTHAAIKYFEKLLLGLLPSDLTTRASAYSQLGYLRQKQGKLDIATQMYAQSMHHDTMHLSRLLHNLDRAANYHASVLGDWTKAKAIWLQQLNIQYAFQSEEAIARTYENLARAAIAAKQHVDAIEYISLAIKSLPNDHPRLASLQEQLQCEQRLQQ